MRLAVNATMQELMPFLDHDWRSQAALCHLRPILCKLFASGFTAGARAEKK
jgi:hypothetical protein